MSVFYGRGNRDHSHMRFADSFTQDMEFWRQRVGKEAHRLTESSFTQETLSELPRNPFRDSAGMLLGPGVSPRNGETPLGVLAPNLASFRTAVQPCTILPNAARPNPWQLGRAAPYHLPQATGATPSPETRAMRGAFALDATFAPEKKYEKHLLIEAPDMRICASRRRGMPRSRLDARMYAPSPG